MNLLQFQLQQLVKFLSSQKIKYAILGGIAVSIYGEPRLTLDIDVNILFDKRNLSEFLKKARKYGFYPLSADTEEIVKKTGIIPLKFIKGQVIGKVDIIIAENILEYASIDRSRIKKISSVKARLVSPEDLVIHKIASPRPRDFEDLKGILIRQRGKLDIRYIQYWLRKIDRVNKESKRSESFRILLKKLYK